MTQASPQISTDIDLLLREASDGVSGRGFHTLSRDRLLNAIRENEAEIERIRSDLRRREAETARLKQVSQFLKDETSDDSSSALPVGFGKRQRQRTTSFAWAVRRETCLALKEAGHPLNSKQLYAVLKSKNIPFTNDNPVKAITRVLWKADEFVSNDGAYWFSDAPLPAGHNQI